MLLRPLDQILGTTTKVRILRALFPLDDVVSGREVERLAGVTSRSALSGALDHLSELGIVRRREAAGVHLYQINPEHDLAPALASLFEAESARFGLLRSTIRSALAEAGLEDSIVSAVVFGSMARSDARPDSDLDLLLVAVRADQAEPLQEALLDRAEWIGARFGLRLSPLVLPGERVRERFRDGDPLMQNILHEGRTLLGLSFREVVDAW